MGKIGIGSIASSPHLVTNRRQLCAEMQQACRLTELSVADITTELLNANSATPTPSGPSALSALSHMYLTNDTSLTMLADVVHDLVMAAASADAGDVTVTDLHAAGIDERTTHARNESDRRDVAKNLDKSLDAHLGPRRDGCPRKQQELLDDAMWRVIVYSAIRGQMSDYGKAKRAECPGRFAAELELASQRLDRDRRA